MFNNIGGKIKTLAFLLAVLGIMMSVIVGILTIIIPVTQNGFTGGNHSIPASQIWSGILIIVIGSLSSWIGSFLLYGFGQLIESAQNIEKHIIGINSTNKSSHNSIPVNAQPTEKKKSLRCTACGAENALDSLTCANCGNKLA